MKVFICGGSGFIGSAIARKLNGKHEVYAMVRTLQNPEKIPLAVHQIQHEYKDTESLTQCLESIQPDIIINALAYGIDTEKNRIASRLYEGNVLFIHSLFKAASKFKSIKKIIHLGSCFEYGRAPNPLKESSICQPTNFYGESKLFGSKYALEIARELQIPTLVLRIFGLWGPFEPANRLIPQIFKAQMNQQVLKFTKSEQVRDYLNVEDLAESFSRLVDFPFEGYEIFNYGSGESITLYDFISHFGRELNMDHLFDFGGKPYRSDEMMELVANMDKAKQFGLPIPKLGQYNTRIMELKKYYFMGDS